MLSIIARVAQALAYGYLRNVVHRDINPANIMYDPQAEIKALAKNVAKRYRSGDEFAQALRACAAQCNTVDFTL